MIKKNKNSFTVFLSRGIYDRASVEKACSAFKDFFNCDIKEEDSEIILEANTGDEEAVLEFANYLFAVVKKGE